MYCTRCGIQLQDDVAFCSGCGHQVCQNAPTQPAGPHPRLSRPVYDKKIAGVCAGFARYFGVDVTLVRILWLVLVFWPLPIGLIAYIIAWIVMPRDPLALPEAKPGTEVAPSSKPVSA